MGNGKYAEPNSEMGNQRERFLIDGEHRSGADVQSFANGSR